MQQTISRGFAPESVTSVRRIAFYACAALLTLGACADFVSHALDFAAPHHIHVIVHEIFSGYIIVVAASQLIAPQRFFAAAQQLLALFIAAWALDALTLRFSGLGLVLLLGVFIALLHPARAEVFSFRGRFRLSLAIITALGAGPLVAFGLSQAALQRDNVAPIHASLGHWEWTAALAFTLILLGALSALSTTGFRVPVWSTGLGAALFGLASLLYAGEASSVSNAWAISAIAGGILFIAVAEWEARRAVKAQQAHRASGDARSAA